MWTEVFTGGVALVYTPPAEETIVNSKDDPACVLELINHYARYINYLSTKGGYFDCEAKYVLDAKLLEAIHRFDLSRYS